MYRNYFIIIPLILFSLVLVLLSLGGKIGFLYSLSLIVIPSISCLYFDIRRAHIIQYYKVRIEEIQEEINLAEGRLKKKNVILKELPSKVEKIFSIKRIAERVVDFIDTGELCRNIVNEIGNLFYPADNVLLFLFHMRANELSLEYSFKRNNEVIKEKKGDAVDLWVLKNNKNLLIEDTVSDYRFDFKSLHAYKDRGARSIIGSPLSIGSRLYGVVRIESKKPASLSLEDARVLRVVCDLAAVVLEKTYLFTRIKELGIRDSLTNLFLRNYFLDRLKEELERMSLKNAHLGAAIIDIDDLKKINDTYGHTVGDLALKKVSSALRASVKGAGDITARLGGEEFAFFVTETDKEKAKTIAENVRKKVARSTVNFRRKHINITVSIGLAMYPEDGIDIQPLLNAADRFLYQAKKQGKNKVCFS